MIKKTHHSIFSQEWARVPRSLEVKSSHPPLYTTSLEGHFKEWHFRGTYIIRFRSRGGRGPGCCIWHAGSENGEAGNCPEVSLKIPNGFTLTNVKKHHLHLCFPTWQASPPTVTTSSIPSASCLWDAVLPERTVTELWKQGKYFLLWSKRDECRK